MESDENGAEIDATLVMTEEKGGIQSKMKNSIDDELETSNAQRVEPFYDDFRVC